MMSKINLTDLNNHMIIGECGKHIVSFIEKFKLANAKMFRVSKHQASRQYLLGLAAENSATLFFLT